MEHGKRRPASDDDQPSERQRKLRKVRNPGANDKERGQVHYDAYGQMLWLDRKNSKWIKTLYHADIRAQLLDRASNNGILRYSVPRAKGRSPYDETAFHAGQQNWSCERAHWERVRDNILHRLERRGYTGEYHDSPVQDWYEGEYIGKLVFSINQQLLRNY